MKRLEKIRQKYIGIKLWMPRTITIVTVLCALLFVKTSSAYATSGALKINNHVIYEEITEENSWSETTFVIPDLFLTSKTMIEEQFKQKQEDMIVEARVGNFSEHLDESQPTLHALVNEKLFKEEQMAFHTDSIGEDSTNRGGREIIITVSIVLGGIVLVTSSVFLGKQFSYHRDRSKR